MLHNFLFLDIKKENLKMPKGTNWPRICEEAPNSFLNSANMILFYQNPPPDASCDHVLSLEIWDQFLNNRLDEQSYINKIKAWQDLNTYFRVFIYLF